MRYREEDYKIVVNNGVYVFLAYPEGVSKTADEIQQAIRLVIDETAMAVFTSSMQKDLIVDIDEDDTYTGYDYYIKFATPSGKTIAATDKFTIEMDWGEMPATIQSAVKDGNDTAIGMLKDNTNGLAAIKLQAAQAASDAAAAKTAAQGITGYALQGNDSMATNTAIAALIGYTINEIDGV